MTIECLRFKPLEKGTLQGFADFYVPKTGMEIYGCSLHMKNGGRWVNLPSKEYEAEGERKFSPVIRFRDRNHQEAFSKMALSAIEKWVKENPKQEEDALGEIPF